MAKAKTDNGDTISVEMVPDRDTKGTYVYKSVDKLAMITSLYIRKEAYTGERPERIVLTVARGREGDDERH
jgi:hypothetical protein